MAGTESAFEFSPETFSDTEPGFVLKICEAVKAAWEPSVENTIIFNLPTTVEICSKIPVHQRAPYGGSLIVCAFSGSHQDAIKKGFELRERDGKEYDDEWKMPYLPLDPQDIGRTYETVIRVTQSGKGGATWIILRGLQLDLPRGLQLAFSKVVQNRTDGLGRELLAKEITAIFEEIYSLNENSRFSIVDYSITTDRSRSPVPTAPGKTPVTKDLMRVFNGVISVNGKDFKLQGRGNGPISSLANALKGVGVNLDVKGRHLHRMYGNWKPNASLGRGHSRRCGTEFFDCPLERRQQHEFIYPPAFEI